MEEELKRFVYHKNGWNNPSSSKKNPNVKGEKIGTLWLDGKQVKTASFPLLQVWKRNYCKNYGISKERAAKRFKITY